MVKPVIPNELYNEYYYKHDCGTPYERSPEWLNFFAGIAEKIAQKINPESVLDAGCAMGFLVEGLREKGIEAFGLDISDYAIQKVHEKIKPYCQTGSVLDPLPRRYGLIVCIEVFEHLQPHTSEHAVENLCNASDDIIFSSSPLDYYEVTHFNVQPPEYWADLFAINGFVRDVDFDASFITPWAVRFRKNSEPVHQVLRNYERKFWLLWKENQDMRRLTLNTRNEISSRESTMVALESNVAALEFSFETAKKDLLEKNKQLVETLFQIQEKEQALQSIYDSRAWHFIVSIRKFKNLMLPNGSIREKIIQKIYQGYLTLRGFFLNLSKYSKMFIEYLQRAMQHLRLYGIKSLLTRLIRKFHFLAFRKNNSFLVLEEADEVKQKQKRDLSVLLNPLVSFATPYHNKRINIVLDTLRDDAIFDGTVDAVIFAVLLAEEWGCDLRIVTRLDISQKTVLSRILKDNGISGPNIEFLFVPAGNPKIALPVGNDETFLATSWLTVKGIIENFNSRKVIYLLEEDERKYPYPVANKNIFNEILENTEIQFLIRTRHLYKYFVSEGYENMRDNGLWFEPSFPDAFYSPQEKTQDLKKVFLFYTQDEDLLDIGVDAVNLAISNGLLDTVTWEYYFVCPKPDLKITLGSLYVPRVVQSPYWKSYPKLLQTVDLGLCLTESHNSTSPILELIASGAVVVTNFMADEKDAALHSRNLICTDGNLSGVIDGLAESLRLIANQQEKKMNFQNSMILRNWRISFEEILKQIRK